MGRTEEPAHIPNETALHQRQRPVQNLSRPPQEAHPSAKIREHPRTCKGNQAQHQKCDLQLGGTCLRFIRRENG